MDITELTRMGRQWTIRGALQAYGGQMASSEVDRKFLGHFAKSTISHHGYLSSFLFRILGLSVVLSEDLLHARRVKRLDPIRDPQHRRLVHHILWLAREGLVMMEQYVQPMVGKRLPAELQVLVLKLKASLYHIFVLFHNEPSVNDRVSHPSQSSLFPLPLSPKSRSSNSPTSPPTTRQRSPAISIGKSPPGLPWPPGNTNNPYSYANLPSAASATYLLPLTDYRPAATAAFKEAELLAERLLPGSHPVRLSVKVEYVAYLYDCVKDREGSRKLAKRAVREVYEESAGMDDESFEDAAELVGILGRMMKRGLGSSGSGDSGRSPPVTQQQQQQQQQPTPPPSTSRHRRTESSSNSNNRSGGGGGSVSVSRPAAEESRSQGQTQGAHRRTRSSAQGGSMSQSQTQTQSQSAGRSSRGRGGNGAGGSSSNGRGSGSRRVATTQPTTWV